MNRIGIFGIGAIGSVLLNYLRQNEDNELYQFNRTTFDSLSLTHTHQEFSLPITLSNLDDYNLDWLIICIKEYHVNSAIVDIQKLVNKKTKLAIFQNGINLSNQFIEVSEPNNILETIIDCPVERIGKKKFKQLRTPLITLPKNQISDQFKALFKNAKINWSLSDNFKTQQWVKLIESSSIGVIQAVTEKPCIIFNDSTFLNDYKILVNEAIKVALSENINFEKEFENTLIENLLKYPSSKGSSMLYDKLNGRTLELDAKMGAIISIAKKNGVAAPLSNEYFENLLTYNRTKTPLSLIHI